MQLAHEAGLPSPRVMHVLTPQDGLGTGFIMERVEGETIPRKILRDEQFAQSAPDAGAPARQGRSPASMDCRVEIAGASPHDGDKGDRRS